MSLTIQKSMRFNHYGEIRQFRSVVHEDVWGECIRLTGTVRESQLMVKAYLVWGNQDGRHRGSRISESAAVAS